MIGSLIAGRFGGQLSPEMRQNFEELKKEFCPNLNNLQMITCVGSNQRSSGSGKTSCLAQVTPSAFIILHVRIYTNLGFRWARLASPMRRRRWKRTRLSSASAASKFSLRTRRRRFLFAQWNSRQARAIFAYATKLHSMSSVISSIKETFEVSAAMLTCADGAGIKVTEERKTKIKTKLEKKTKEICDSDIAAWTGTGEPDVWIQVGPALPRVLNYYYAFHSCTITQNNESQLLQTIIQL